MANDSKNKNTVGRFVWHELMTSDPSSARGFYGELLGWSFRDMNMGPSGAYTIVSIGDRDIAGIVKPDAKANAPTHWVGYVTSADVDATAQRVTSLGGKVHVPPTDIPNVGRFAILADSQGGTFATIKMIEERAEQSGPPAAGDICWDELHARDPKAAATFYSELYGLTVSEMPMGAESYRVLKRGDKDTGGVLKAKSADVPVMWLSYVAVADVDAMAKRADKLGGRTLVAPGDIPNMGRFAVLADRQGAVFALWKPAAK